MVNETCKIHPDKEIVDVCAHCGKKVCALCAATLADKTYCLECIKLVDANAQGQPKTIEWENRSEIGLLKALIGTWKQILLHPKKFFASMPTKAAIGSPLLFALICGSAAIIASAFVNMLVVLSGTTLPNVPPGSTLPPKAVMVGSYVVLMIISPLLVAAGIFVISAVYHLIVLIFGGKEGFRATFRVLSYSNALAIFNIVPLAGPIFVTVYSVILFVIGFKNAHKMNTARAVMVALLPMVILFVIGFAAAFYLASQGAALQGGK
ncbi:MAG: hypothetical protein COW11_04710 [Candidatus Omnitrophica bacterium CG12_big_fil_rev_8_21_14_0_65_43_15]|uniref:Yip1 domain-containing protein n=1 Tax=Candidatus Taenaricola geysiri TaxID=1974752 RepID=A0A2J0LJF0_9BACT|nr:MAG: hypothetical protein AUJ89_04655 [Candidatus Omnitrophica bacterium CG1_02_43_210]PIV12511.1 MAG: hypothetical protein COS48_00290 [Candidatus Omnitrophica bacterium CG03_land_8_20_14_0_80_43_22]PIW66170.1 MAG: hypothetical protein COW11_04710 [Candidatus Omnitrophica bacterium CG12_big_fil_rev_8_21_14_0_65_43_15]PIW80229.1 MAG: hypothetical protein COZ98_03205 [Candidatus Omnitrophica bacterium CG_4_8_14_3_um_filter_43_15]PIY84280.1 MAG: hypothetical protein COY77_03340 [Candidatus Omn